MARQFKLAVSDDRLYALFQQTAAGTLADRAVFCQLRRQRIDGEVGTGDADGGFMCPMLYAIGRELYPQRSIAIFSALVYLTLLPVVRHGRLAMLDGAVLCFLLASMWCLLRSRRDLRYALGAGIGFGLICLTKGVMLGLLLGAIGLVFLVWDTPRLLTSGYLWGGLAIGTFPVAGWYFAQWLHYGQDFINANLLNQSFRRIWEPVSNHNGPPWYYLLEILESSLAVAVILSARAVFQLGKSQFSRPN